MEEDGIAKSRVGVKRHRPGACLVCLAPVSHLFRPCLGVVYMYSLSPTYFSIHQIHHRTSMVLVHNPIPIVGNTLVQRRTDKGGKGCKPEELIRRCQGLALATSESSPACTQVRAKRSLTAPYFYMEKISGLYLVASNTSNTSNNNKFSYYN